MDELAFATALELADKITNKEVSSLELTNHYIDRIERFDGPINAVIVRRFEAARESARGRRRARAR